LTREETVEAALGLAVAALLVTVAAVRLALAGLEEQLTFLVFLFCTQAAAEEAFPLMSPVDREVRAVAAAGAIGTAVAVKVQTA
jgi:hypothetical protein